MCNLAAREVSRIIPLAPPSNSLPTLPHCLRGLFSVTSSANRSNRSWGRGGANATRLTNPDTRTLTLQLSSAPPTGSQPVATRHFRSSPPPTTPPMMLWGHTGSDPSPLWAWKHCFFLIDQRGPQSPGEGCFPRFSERWCIHPHYKLKTSFLSPIPATAFS